MFLKFMVESSGGLPVPHQAQPGQAEAEDGERAGFGDIDEGAKPNIAALGHKVRSGVTSRTIPNAIGVVGGNTGIPHRIVGAVGGEVVGRQHERKELAGRYDDVSSAQVEIDEVDAVGNLRSSKGLAGQRRAWKTGQDSIQRPEIQSK